MFGRNQQKSQRDSQRRRATGLGQPAQTAFSYHTKRLDRNPNGGPGRLSAADQIELNNNRTVSKSLRLTVFIGLLVLLVGVLLELRVSTNANVQLIQPYGFSYQSRPMSQYDAVVANAIGASLYDQLKLTITSQDLAGYITARLPEVQYVSVTVPFIGATPSVYLQLQSPAVVYATSHGEYLLDAQGVVIAPASAINAKQLSQLDTVVDSSMTNVNVGSRVLNGPNVSFIETVAQALKLKSVSVSKMVLVPGTEEMDVYIANQPYRVKFNLYEPDALQQVGTYLATIATLKQKNITPSQYIDVRVDGRAYYK